MKKILLVIMAVLLSSCSGLSSVSETEMAERSSDCMSAAETEKSAVKISVSPYGSLKDGSDYILSDNDTVRSYEYHLLNEDGHWKFDDFVCYN